MLCTGEQSAEQAPTNVGSLGSAGPSSSLTAFFKQLAKPHKARNGTDGAAQPVGVPASGQPLEGTPSLGSSLGNEGKPPDTLSASPALLSRSQQEHVAHLPRCSVAPNCRV